MRPTSCGQDVSRSKAMSSNAGSNGGLHEGKHLGTKWRQKVFGLLVEIAMENPERLVVRGETAAHARSTHGGRGQCGLLDLLAAVFA